MSTAEQAPVHCPPPCPWHTGEHPDAYGRSLCSGTYPVQHETWKSRDPRYEGNHWCPSCRRSFYVECDYREENE